MYDAEKDLNYVNRQLAYYLSIVGLDYQNIDFYTIDIIINRARKLTQAPIDEVESNKLNYHDNDLYLFLKNQRISLIGNIRRIWYMRQLALGAIKNAV